MEHVRNRHAEKRRDLARSTCSPTKGAARFARKAKRNVNHRVRRAQNVALVAAQKAVCLCHQDPDECPRCDQGTSQLHFKSSKTINYWRARDFRQGWDKLSQIFRWADARAAELSSAEFLHEVQSFGKRVAHAHAVFHLLKRYAIWSESECTAPTMTVAALQCALRERGLEWCQDTRQLLTVIARRICTHGVFEQADQWSFELCFGLLVVDDGIKSRGESWRGFKGRQHLRDLDDGWWIDQGARFCFRPLRGIEDVVAWATEIQHLFDEFWGRRFLKTPEGRWIVGELVTAAIPRAHKTPSLVRYTPVESFHRGR
jgi:hypothetical protein